MIRWLILILMIAALFCTVAGCSKQDPVSDESEVTVKTEAEYKAEAEQQITEENMDAELDKLEQEIETELKAEEQ
ncbi:MAG: hypothetical protein JXA82_02435 [Sedimentisphaerales bacterium]|nr:hypothetical protein [Sedimentisphaerales bacterium]